MFNSPKVSFFVCVRPASSERKLVLSQPAPQVAQSRPEKHHDIGCFSSTVKAGSANTAMVVVHFPPTMDFSGGREQAQGLSQFIEVKEFRFAIRRNLIGQVSIL